MEFIEINLLFFLINNGVFVFLSIAVSAIAANSQSMQVEASTTEPTSSSSSLSSSSAAAAGALTEATEGAGGSTEKLLSRKRRYLLFPEGSSFQLVYDEVIGIVDYTNYLILGITVALAWELPSKAPSEQLEDLRTRLQDGTLDISRNDTITNIKYHDSDKEKSRKLPSPSPTALPFDKENKLPLRANHKQDAHADFGANPFYVPMHPSFYLYSDNKRAQNSLYQNFHSSPSPVSSTTNYGRHHYRPSNDNAYYYYHNKRRNPFQSFIQNNSNQGRASKYPWWNLSNRLSHSWQQRKKARLQQQQHQYDHQGQQTNGFQRSTSVRKHRIFPVFGKRSTASLKNVSITSSAATNTTPTITVKSQQREQQNYFISRHGIGNVNHHWSHQQGQQQHRQHRQHRQYRQHLNKQNLLYVRHHRQTRQTLYEKIEMYLNKRGVHGHHCVLRALCETGQKSHEYDPGSFVAELMRTIFTLPEPLKSHEAPMLPLERIHPKHHRYDAAHAYTGDCASRYQHCKQSLFMSEFLL